MKIRMLSVLLATALVSISAFAADGNDWRRSTPESRLQEMHRVLGNIEANGCTVRHAPEYYVRQLDDFYAESATRKIQLPQALGLIASAAGEDWDC